MSTNADIDRFVKRFPEFGSVPHVALSKALDGAVLFVASDVWGDKATEGIDYLAAHRLASGPGGFGVRTESKATGWYSTIYGSQFLTMMRAVSPIAARVVGGTGEYGDPVG